MASFGSILCENRGISSAVACDLGELADPGKSAVAGIEPALRCRRVAGARDDSAPARF